MVVSMVVGTTEPPEVTDDVSLVGMVDVPVGISDELPAWDPAGFVAESPFCCVENTVWRVS